MTEYVDSSTVTLKVTPSGVDVAARIDASTVTLKLTPSGDDVFTPLWVKMQVARFAQKWGIERFSQKWRIVPESLAPKWSVVYFGKAT